MADKKEKDLTKVSDAAYIRALDSNGNPVLISKADLAQVAAELIGTATARKDGLCSRFMRVVFHEDMSGKGVVKLNIIGSYGYAYLEVVAYDGGNNSRFAITVGTNMFSVSVIGGQQRNIVFKTEAGNTALYIAKEDYANWSLGMFLIGTSKPGFNVETELVSKEDYEAVKPSLSEMPVS